jgi:hypothetical protein
VAREWIISYITYLHRHFFTSILTKIDLFVRQLPLSIASSRHSLLEVDANLNR